MRWLSGNALVTGIVAGVIVLVVVLILGAIVPTAGFTWALGVSTVSSFFAGYFGHIAGARRGLGA
jgi:hypothetical protein